MVLHPAVEAHLAAVGHAVGLDLAPLVAGIGSPLREVGRAVLVAQAAVGGIGQQPVAVGLDEGLVVGPGCRARSAAGEGRTQQPLLGAVDPLVVDLPERVQLVAQTAVFVILGNARRRQAEELGMERIDGVGVVGIGVLPRAAHRGVVDR